MDYLNPKKRKAHLVRLFVGYGIIAIGVAIGVAILFFLVLGFSYKNGVVIQNGMLYVSSSPSNATISLDGSQSGTTNKRFITEAGKYTINLTKTGYRPWSRTIDLAGGKVQRYDYPLLIPNQLTSSSILTLDGQPPMVTQSPNHRWLLIKAADDPLKFKLIDFSTPTSPVITNYSLPASVVSGTAAGASEAWQTVEWSNDNQHVLLEHNFGDQHEFIMVDITNPASSLNLEAAFGAGASPDEISLFNGNYDQYWFYDEATHALSRANLSDKSITPYLDGVLAYKTYADNIVLYATASGAAAGQARILWHQGGQNYPITSVPLGASLADYLLDLAQFNGDMYAVAGETSANAVTVYKNPIQQLGNHPNFVRPFWIMKLASPNYMKFSANAQFVLAENGKSVAVTNLFYHTGYSYELGGLDAPQAHANWMDGYHLIYVNGGLVRIIDFNDLNPQSLVAASADYQPLLDANGEYLFTLATGSSNGATTTTLERTPLRISSDL